MVNMAKKVVTLYIDDTSIRLLVARGKRITKWVDLSLEPGLVGDGIITEPAKLADKLKQFLSTQKVKQKKVIVGSSALLCLTRPIILPQLPKAMLAEAVTREAERLLPVALEELYISWQTIPAPEGKTQVFLVAMRRKSADALLTMLQQAGLNPYIMGIKPLALARLVTEATTIIIDVQPTEFDVVIMADGVPELIRSLPLPKKAASFKKKLSIVKEELERTIKFYNSNNPEASLDSDVPIYVSGELAHEPELLQSLSDELGHPVLSLSSPLECPKGLAITDYMVNIGLALKEPSLGKRAGPSVVNSNLLPTPYRPKPIPWTKVVALPTAATIIGLVVPLVMLISSASANATSMRDQLVLTNQLLREKQLQEQELRKNIAEWEKKLVEVEIPHNTLTASINNFTSEQQMVNSNLEVATDSLPSTVSLTSISYSSSLLTISGKSPSEAEVLFYARKLESSGQFSETIIASLKRMEDGSMTFALLLTK